MAKYDGELLINVLIRGNNLCESMQMETVLAAEIKEMYMSIRDHFVEFPLISAAYGGYDRLVWGFIKSATMTNTDLHTGETLDLQKFLGYTDSTGQTALHYAASASQRRFEVVTTLLQYVSEESLTSYRDCNGCTPLSLLKDPEYDSFIFETLKAAAGKMDPFVSKHQGLMASKTHVIGQPSKTPAIKAIGDYKKVDMAGTSYPTSHKNEKQSGLDNLDEDKCELTPNRNTILHLVTKFGDVGYTKSILKKHPSLIEFRNFEGETPLYVAAREGNIDVLRILINHVKNDELKLELLTRSVDKHTALHIAIENHHAGVVFLLVKEIPKLAKCINLSNESPLNLAVERKFYHIFRLILDECSEKAFEGINGKTALHTAAAVAPSAFIEDLLHERKDLLTIHNNYGWTPLQQAVFCNNLEATNALLKEDPSIGYQMSKRNGKDSSAIHVAVSRGYHDQIKALVSNCPGCLEMIDSNGKNILHLAIEEKKIETFSFILSEFKSVTTDLINQKDSNGDTPFHLLAASTYVSDLVALDNRANLYARNKKFCTPINMASSQEKRRKYIQAKEQNDRKLEEVRRRQKKREEDEEKKRKQEDENRRHEEKLQQEEKRQEEKRRHEEERQRMASKMGDNVVLVVTLIATATFAAAFTVPGGFDGDQDSSTQGMPILLRKAFYKVFVVSNALAFSCSCCVLCGYIRIQLYNYAFNKLKDEDKRGYVNIINLQYLLTGFAMTTMAVAFITGTYVILTPSLGFAISLFAISVCIIVPFSLFPAKGLGFATKIVSMFEKA